MHREEENERREEPMERMIVQAFHSLLAEEEYRLSYAMAQELYNRICRVLLLVPTIIMGE